jgi:hypothetical protein
MWSLRDADGSMKRVGIWLKLLVSLGVVWILRSVSCWGCVGGSGAFDQMLEKCTFVVE